MRKQLPRVMAALACGLVLGGSAVLEADWQRDAGSIAWRAGADTVWRFSYDAKHGKAFFDPLGPVGGPSLTNFKPEDHPWHYGLWFSWKYINDVNYWEEDRRSGQAVGKTQWNAPVITTQPDGRATITLAVSYVHPSGRVDLTEARELIISTPDAAGGYTIDWRSRFVAGAEGAVLGRTPMPGEPGGQVNGGYAGIGARLASMPLVMSVVTAEGPVTEFVNDRARPASSAIACNFTLDGKDAGALAILSDPSNIGERAPWYLINNPTFRYADPAILAPAVRTLKAGDAWVLRYRFAVTRTTWTPATLRTALAAWLR